MGPTFSTPSAILIDSRLGETETVSVCEHFRAENQNDAALLLLDSGNMSHWKDSQIFKWVNARVSLQSPGCLTEEIIKIFDASTNTSVSEDDSDLRLLFEASHELLCTAGFDGYFKRLNSAWTETLGYTLTELRSKPFIEFVHPDDREVTIAEASRLTSGESTTRFENRYLAKDGSYRHLLWSTTVSVGRQTYFCVVRDVTHQKEMEAQLGETRRMESIGQLAAGVAHEINTPMQYIGNNLAFLEVGLKCFSQSHDLLSEIAETGAVDSDLLQKIQKLLADMKRRELIDDVPIAVSQSIEGASRVASIITSLREFSHPDNEKTFFDLNRIIRNAAVVSRNTWSEFAELELDLEEELEPFYCLPGELGQVFLNLITNASDAIQELGQLEKGTIRIRTRTEGPMLVATISDSGAGIPDALRQRVFDLFFTTKEVGQGTGQGLSISHSIVTKNHGGKLELVDPEDGQGTTFKILLP
ncbi:MAG: PAS domain S-box protein, partial [Candidatus Eisenbacteria bacterium]|nr:PAS domain S-box protein [Candidatus Eisenbacteria bacterium]